MQQVENALSQQPSVGVEDKWSDIKNAITKSARQNLGVVKKTKAKKPWVTLEMLEKMEERRRWKNSSTDDGKRRYKKLSNELRRETDKARKK